MTGENIKDIRQMLELVSKDFERLSTDLKYLGVYLEPLQKELNDVENVGHKGALQSRS